MAQLRQDYQKFKERNTEIIAIGPEDNKTFNSWWHKHHMPFIGVADPGQQVKLIKLGRMPASLLLDKKGYIRYKHFGESMSDIPENQQVLSLIDKLNGEGDPSR
jgi:peroxiredoxin